MDRFPTRKNFNDMMQNPRLAFRNVDLQKSDIERDPVGLPRARAGTFADVYRAILPNRQSRAVRVFATSQPERQERYQAIHEHLRRTALPFLLPFTYEDTGVRASDGKWYPLITMEWVEGDTLFDWLQKRIDARDGRSIAVLAERWRSVVRGLQEARIAHGDLQHANVLVTNSGEIKLVDYDGMCVPQLVGRRNLEIGVDPYQHPARDGNTPLSLSLDNFSAIFIYVGLKALAAEPVLWQEFIARPLYDKILFRREDLDAPARSPLFNRLGRSPDVDVRRLATALGELPRQPLEQTPFLEELVGQFDFKVVRTLLDKRDFDAAVGMLTRNNKKKSDAPADLQPRLTDAQRRVEKLSELLAAVDAGDERAMVAIAGAPQLQGYPRATDALTIARDAAAAMPALQRLEAARSNRRWRDLVREWDASQAALTRPHGSLRRSAAKYAGDVASWRERNRLCDLVLQAVRAPRPDPSAFRETWRKLTDLGGHPECDSHRSTIDKLLAALQPVQQAPRAVTVSPRPIVPPQAMQPAGSRPTVSPTGSQAPVLPPPPPPPPKPASATPVVKATTAISSQASVVGGAVGGTGSTTTQPSAVRQKWNEFVGEATISISGFLMSRVPPLRWLSQRLAGATVAPDASQRALLLGKSAAIGSLTGAVIGLFALAVARASWGSVFPAPAMGRPWIFMLELFRLAPWVIGAASLAAFVGHNRHLQRPSLDWRHIFVGVAAGTATGAGAWLVLLVIQTFVPSLYRATWLLDANGWLERLLHETGSMLVWLSLATVLGLVVSRTIPNLGLRNGAVAGLAGGLVGWCGFRIVLCLAAWLKLGSVVASSFAIICGLPLLGLAVATLAAWVEATNRRFGLELRGSTPIPLSIGLGSRPVTAGAHPKCDVYVSHGNCPVAYEYRVENDQVFLLDYAAGQAARVAVGDRRTLGPLTLAVVPASGGNLSVLPTGSRVGIATTGVQATPVALAAGSRGATALTGATAGPRPATVPTPTALPATALPKPASRPGVPPPSKNP